MNNLKNEKALKVEQLAAQLLTTAPGSYAYEALKNDITLAVMAYKGMDAFDGNHFCLDQTLEDSRGYFEYSGLVLAEAISFAVARYGKTDEMTGKVIPFCYNNI